MDEMFAIKCQNCGGPMYSHRLIFNLNATA